MKRMMSTLLALGMIAAMLSIFVGTAGAQTGGPSGQITVVNGTTATVKVTTVAADGSEIVLGNDLAPGKAGTPTALPAGTYTITFSDAGNTVAQYTLPLDVQAIWNVVSGYASPSDSTDPNANNALAYTVHDEPTPAVTVANSSAVEVTVMPAGTPIPLGNLVAMPDNTAINLTTPGGSDVPVDLSGAPATSYSMVVAVGPDDGLIAATVTIADLAKLRADLAGTVPPSTTIPPSTTVPPSTTIPPSTTVPPSTTIPSLIPVPDVVGQDAADARATLEAEGFVVEITEEASETVETGLVIETNPSAGTEVAEGTTVVLAVSTGLGDVVVPDFSGMTISEATKAAEDVDLAITFVEDPNKPDPEGIVVSQDPAEGTTVEAGSEVVATLSPEYDDAWTILVVDADRELTVTGINFKFNTSTVSAVVDTTISQTTGVGQSGSWTTKLDISSLDNSEHFLVVTGTAVDGSDYAQTFKIPPAGQSTDQPHDGATDEGSGFPWWGWLIIGLLIIAVVAIAIKVFGGSDGTDGQSSATDGGTPPPPPPPPVTETPAGDTDDASSDVTDDDAPSGATDPDTTGS